MMVRGSDWPVGDGGEAAGGKGAFIVTISELFKQ